MSKEDIGLKTSVISIPEKGVLSMSVDVSELIGSPIIKDAFSKLNDSCQNALIDFGNTVQQLHAEFIAAKEEFIAKMKAKKEQGDK
jgi:hypothetical protein